MKEPGEVEALQRAAALTDACLEHAVALALPGTTERAIARAIQDYALDHGGRRALLRLDRGGGAARRPSARPSPRRAAGARPAARARPRRLGRGLLLRSHAHRRRRRPRRRRRDLPPRLLSRARGPAPGASAHRGGDDGGGGARDRRLRHCGGGLRGELRPRPRARGGRAGARVAAAEAGLLTNRARRRAGDDGGARDLPPGLGRGPHRGPVRDGGRVACGRSRGRRSSAG